MSLQALNQIGVLFLLAAAGYFARKKGVVIPAAQSSLSALVVNVSVPAAILASADMPLRNDLVTGVGVIFIGASLHYIIALLLMRAAFLPIKTDRITRNVVTSLAVFANVGFIGFPVISIFLPETGIFYASIYTAVFNLFFFLWAPRALSEEKKPFSVKSLLGNINILAVAVMVPLFFLQIKLPFVLGETLSLLASLSVPVSMIVLGSMLGGFRLRELFSTPGLYVVAALRLFLFPLATFFVLKALALPQELATVLLVIGGVPCGTMTAMLATQNGSADAGNFAAKGVLLTTLLFGVSITFIVFLQGLL